jgi:ATP-dependent Lhr-like helicase
VDQAFADRLQPGDRFLLDGRCLEMHDRDWSFVRVTEVAGRPRAPRWGGDGVALSSELARRLYLLRLQAVEALRDGPEALAALLHRDYGLSEPAAYQLVGYFQRQECVSEVPDQSSLLIEVVATGHGVEYYLHTPLNRLANDALVRVAVHRLARDHGRPATSLVADLGFALVLRGSVPNVPELMRSLLAPANFDTDLTAALADSLALRERFQRVAYTGFMLLRNPAGKRRRVGGVNWAERRLFDQVKAHDDHFVLLRQALREIRTDLCDADAARAYAAECVERPIRCRLLAGVSPFVENWTQLAFGPMESVETPAEALQRLHSTLMGGTESHARP